MVIDPEDYKIAVDQAKANLADATTRNLNVEALSFAKNRSRCTMKVVA